MFRPLDEVSLIEVDEEPPAVMREVLLISGVTGSASRPLTSAAVTAVVDFFNYRGQARLPAIPR